MLDVKRLVAVDENGLEQWLPVLKAAFPLVGADVAARAGRARASRHRRATRRDIARRAGRRRAQRLRAVAVHKQPRALHARRLHGGADRAARPTRAPRARSWSKSEDPARVSRRSCASSGSRSAANTCVARGLKALRVRRAALRRDRHRHELGQVPRRRARAPTARGARSPTARRSRGSAKGWTHRRPRRRGDGAHGRRRSPAWSTRRDRARRRGDRRGRHGRAADRAQRRRAHRRRAGAQRRRVEVLRGEEEARLAYVGRDPALGPSAGTRVVFDTGGGSSQFTFGDGGRVDERFSVDVGAVRFTERYGLDRGRVARARCAAALGDRGRARAARRPPGARCGRRHGRRGHQPRRRQARARRLRPRRGPGDGARPRARSTARSSSTARAAPTSGARSSACSRTAPR